MAKPALAPIEETPEGSDSSVSLKDAYDEWLRDVDQLTHKRKGKKKSRRLAALRHLAQPTESSTSKSVLARQIESPPTTKQDDKNSAATTQLSAQKRRFLTLAAEANYDHFSYEAPWMPGLAFFELLASLAKSRRATETLLRQNARSRPSATPTSHCELANFPILVPATVLRLSESDGVVFLFAVEEEQSHEPEVGAASQRTLVVNEGSAWTLRFCYFTKRDEFESRLPWILRIISSRTVRSDAPDGVAVLKTTSDRGSQLLLLQSVEALDQALRALWDARDGANFPNQAAIQAYIPSKGSVPGNGRAWIARPVYRKKDQSATTVWILTSSGSRFVSTHWRDEMETPPCQIVRCTTAQSWRQPRVIVETLCQYLDSQLVRPSGAEPFAEIVIDLVQDATGHWWLLQVNAFQFRPSLLPSTQAKDTTRARSAPDRLETISLSSSSTKGPGSHAKAKWKCVGKFCFRAADIVGDLDNQTTAEPSGFLTKKEILSCEFYDRVQGSGDASVSNSFGSLSSALAFHIQHQLQKRERTALYEPQGLCDNCLRKYYSLRAEMNARLNVETNGDPKQRRHRLTKKTSTTRSLPALVVSLDHKPLLGASSSTGDIPVSVDPLAPPSYMDELERIEKLLADEELPQAGESIPMPIAGPCTKSDELPSTDATFTWQLNPGQDDRIEEMWQSLRLKPLPASSSSRPSGGYNSFSLAKELQTMHGSHSVRAVHSRPAEPHLISVVDCRRVFSDETFREDLVRDASQRLMDQRQAVQFVVLPTGDEQTPTDPQLGKMALQSLALDVMQVLERNGVSLGLGGGLPPVVEDAVGSGCLFMTLPATK